MTAAVLPFRTRVALRAHAVRAAARRTPGPRAVRVLSKVLEQVGWFEARLGPALPKRVAGRWILRPMIPAWPSPAYDVWLNGLLQELDPVGTAPPALAAVLFAVTRRCPLACAHCSAHDELGSKEHLSRLQLLAIVDSLQAHGVAQLHLTGGEPMARFADVLAVVAHASPRSEVWINTAGVGLTVPRAKALAAAGLRGLHLSLDDPSPARHDAFRGLPGTFSWVERAAAAAVEAGLVLTVSVCPTRELMDAGGLEQIRDLAAQWGAHFIRVVEPHAVGKWSGSDVKLGTDHGEAVDAFIADLNASDDGPNGFGDAWLGRKVGCLAGGWRVAYVDSDGDVRGCPFATRKAGSVLDGELSAALTQLRAGGCARFGVPKVPGLATGVSAVAGD